MTSNIRKSIGIGIIGTGNIVSGGHVPAIRQFKNIGSLSILSRNRPHAHEFVRNNELIDTNVYTDIDDFLRNTSIDLVIICSPDNLHTTHAIKCIKAGKHVLLEKPMATRVEDCNSLITLAAQHDVILATGFHLRHHAGHHSLRSLITNEQAIGSIRHIRAIWAWPQKDDSNWRAKQELATWWTLAATGAHCFDIARWFANDFEEWASLKSITTNQIWQGPHEESAIIAGKLSSGITIEIVCSVQFGPYNRLEIFGSDGHAICHDTFRRDGSGEIILNNKKFDFEPVNPFFSQLKNVVDCIHEKNIPIADGYAGLRNTQDLLLATKES